MLCDSTVVGSTATRIDNIEANRKRVDMQISLLISNCLSGVLSALVIFAFALQSYKVATKDFSLLFNAVPAKLECLGFLFCLKY